MLVGASGKEWGLQRDLQICKGIKKVWIAIMIQDSLVRCFMEVYSKHFMEGGTILYMKVKSYHEIQTSVISPCCFGRFNQVCMGYIYI